VTIVTFSPRRFMVARSVSDRLVVFISEAAPRPSKSHSESRRGLRCRAPKAGLRRLLEPRRQVTTAWALEDVSETIIVGQMDVVDEPDPPDPGRNREGRLAVEIGHGHVIRLDITEGGAGGRHGVLPGPMRGLPRVEGARNGQRAL